MAVDGHGVAAAPVQVLIVEDNPDDARLVSETLIAAGLDIVCKRVDSEPAFVEAIKSRVDVILTDQTMPQFSASRVLEILRKKRLHLPVIIVSGTITEERAVEFMEQGASDYLDKARLLRLGTAVRNALERFRYETEAREADARLARMMQDLEVGTTTSDLEGHMLACNSVAWRLLGYESEEAFLKVPTPQHYADADQRQRLQQSLVASGHAKGVDIEFRRADGTSIWGTGEFQAIRDGRGGPMLIEAFFVDSTVRVMERQKVEASERYLQSLLAAAPDAIISFDENARVTTWNTSAESMLGWTQDEVVGHPVVRLLMDGRNDMEPAAGKLGDINFAAQYQSLELTRKDGTKVPIEIALSPPIWHEGKRKYVLYLRDLTERRRAAEEIKSAKERLDSVLSSAPIVVATLDRDLRFTFAAGNTLQKLGVGSAAVVGAAAPEVLVDKTVLLGSIRRAAAGEEFDNEGEFEGRYFHAAFSPIRNGNGEPDGVALVAVDITARHDAETLAKARSKRQQAAVQLAQEALHGMPVSELSQRTVALCTSSLEVEMAAVHELEADGLHARKQASRGYRRPEPQIPIIRGGLIAWLLANSESRSVADYETDDLKQAPNLSREGVRATLATAIRGAKHPFGFLAVHSRTPRMWTADEVEFIQLIGRLLGLAVERERAETERSLLLSRLVNAQEEERRRIAADVHDDAVQVMTAVAMRLHLLRDHLVDDEQIVLATKLESTVSLSIERLRSLLFELNPPALERNGLIAALRMSLDQFERDFKTKTDLVDGILVDPDQATSLVVYRIIQEGLINVGKHAKANRVEVALREVDDGILVQVQDNGIGFVPDENRKVGFGHMGLVAMRERAQMSGGWFKLDSAPGAGTRIEFWVPCARERVGVVTG